MHIDQQMNDFVINLLKTQIPANYYYHNYEHTLYVIDKTVEIGKQEHCTEKELELLAVAALWHDTGYTNSYKDHEEESCTLARQYLPEYGYTTDDVEKICSMIMATKIPQQPKNKLEEIIADADLEYLGTENAAEMAYNLYKELSALNPQLTKEVWDTTEIDFLAAHKYFTSYCNENKQHIKESYLQSLVKNKS